MRNTAYFAGYNFGSVVETDDTPAPDPWNSLYVTTADEAQAWLNGYGDAITQRPAVIRSELAAALYGTEVA